MCAVAGAADLFRNQRRVIRQLAAHLESQTADRANVRVPSELLQRNDEIGRLSRAVSEASRELENCRRQRRSLHKSMNHRITAETRRATAELHSQATTDPLTGLGNRRYLHRWASVLLTSDDVQRTCDSLVALAIDIDLFKPVNDVLGHDAGDDCLTFLGDLLQSSIRQGHCAVRLGGDEFIVIMSEVDVQQGASVAERISMLFAQMPWPHVEPGRPSLSIGVAEHDVTSHDDVDGLIRLADQALYASKRGGRGRVTVHTPPQHSDAA